MILSAVVSQSPTKISLARALLYLPSVPGHGGLGLRVDDPLRTAMLDKDASVK